MSDRRVDTVFVFGTEHAAVAIDQIDAISWSCKWTHRIVVIDRTRRGLGLPDGGSHEVVRVPEDLRRTVFGFQQLAALGMLVDQGWQFGQAILLSEDSLLLGKGLDEWCGLRIKEQDAGVIGVEDRRCYMESFPSCAATFSGWDVPHEIFEDAPNNKTVADPFQALSGVLVRDLFARNLLTPPDCAEWLLPFGPYISWVPQMLGYTQLLHGHMDRQLPPLYVNELRSRQLPSPTILSQEFLLYHSLKGTCAFSANDLRVGYKRLRERDPK